MTGRQFRHRYHRHLHRRHWHDLPPQPVDLLALVPTQWPHYGVCQLCTLRLGRPAEGDDPIPHLAELGGQRFIWDGHTRIARWLRAGQQVGAGKVLRVEGLRVPLARTPARTT